MRVPWSLSLTPEVVSMYVAKFNGLSWLQNEEAEVLIQAVDGSGRGKSKLSTPHYGHYIGWLTADELGLAFGRQTVIHAALASGGLTQRVVEDAQRLKGVRQNEAG